MERESEGWSVSEKPFFTISTAFRQRDQKLQQSLKLQLRLKFKNGETRWLLRSQIKDFQSSAQQSWQLKSFVLKAVVAK